MPLNRTKETTLLTTDVGTPAFKAPEVILEQPYDGRIADIFSLGVVYFVVYSG